MFTLSPRTGMNSICVIQVITLSLVGKVSWLPVIIMTGQLRCSVFSEDRVDTIRCQPFFDMCLFNYERVLYGRT